MDVDPDFNSLAQIAELTAEFSSSTCLQNTDSRTWTREGARALGPADFHTTKGTGHSVFSFAPLPPKNNKTKNKQTKNNNKKLSFKGTITIVLTAWMRESEARRRTIK